MKKICSFIKKVAASFFKDEVAKKPRKNVPWKGDTTNMDPHDVAKMSPPEAPSNEAASRRRDSFRNIKPTKAQPL